MPKPASLFCLLLCSAALISSCTTIPQRSSPEWIGFTETGDASFYAMRYQFQATASGERLNQMASTAAHKELPFGTMVRVTNIANGESVVVKINDRGPFVEGRVIDLTRSAFSEIADTSVGVVQVEIVVIE